MIMDLYLKKYSDYFAELGLILWYIVGYSYIGLGLEKCSDYLTVFWLGLEKNLAYVAGLGLV